MKRLLCLLLLTGSSGCLMVEEWIYGVDYEPVHYVQPVRGPVVQPVPGTCGPVIQTNLPAQTTEPALLRAH